MYAGATAQQWGSAVLEWFQMLEKDILLQQLTTHAFYWVAQLIMHTLSLADKCSAAEQYTQACCTTALAQLACSGYIRTVSP
jgi:hypothetical protein